MQTWMETIELADLGEKNLHNAKLQNFVDVIRIFERIYTIFHLSINKPAFPIKNFLLISGKVVMCFPKVFCNFILFTIVISDRYFVFIIYFAFRLTIVGCFSALQFHKRY